MKMIDCSITENYLKERARMTEKCQINCRDCPFYYPSNAYCSLFEDKYPEKSIEIVQKWSDEHPLKTYKDDFFEKFPNARKREDGIPDICYKKIYGIKYRYGECDNGCAECWNEVMPEAVESEVKNEHS